MSIQLTLSGHSFSHSDLPKLSDGDGQAIEIEVITERVALVPIEVLDESQAGEMLRIAGVVVGDDDRVVVVRDEATEIAALLALPCALLSAAEECYGDKFKFATPLLRTRVCTTPTAWFYLAGQLIYIKVWSDGKLRMAEVLPRTKLEDALYYAATLDKRFGLNGYRVVVSGAKECETEVRETTKLLNKFYNKVVCE